MLYNINIKIIPRVFFNLESNFLIQFSRNIFSRKTSIKNLITLKINVKN